MRTPLFMKRTYQIYGHQCRRAREQDQALDYSLEDLRQEVESSLAAGCIYCMTALTFMNFSCDHGTPISRGGSFSGDNVVVCCRLCNEVKGSLTSDEYEMLLNAMSGWPHEARVSVLKRLRAGAKAMFGR